VTRYRLRLATRDDDAALRQRMAGDVMHGAISVSFRREPDYFAGTSLFGAQTQVVVCEDDTGQIVGLGSRIVRQAYLNGIPSRSGYLSDLRIAPIARRGTLLARGFRFFRALHQADPVPFYSTVILDGNEAALSALTTARAGLPVYSPLGRMLTPALHLDMQRRVPKVAGVCVRRAAPGDLLRVAAFLSREHARKQFAPVWDAAALTAAGPGRLRMEDFWVAERGDTIVGTLATWDQHALRQTHIEAYSKSLSRIRPLYNLLARVTPLKRLPAPGEHVPYLYLSALAIAEDNPDLFAQLLATACNAARKGPWHYAICGLHERDPLAAVLEDYRRIDAAGLLFAVHYAEPAHDFAALDQRVPYVDFGMI
jgi:hypothetical protein